MFGLIPTRLGPLLCDARSVRQLAAESTQYANSSFGRGAVLSTTLVYNLQPTIQQYVQLEKFMDSAVVL
jgi:hypothetical protein